MVAEMVIYTHSAYSCLANLTITYCDFHSKPIVAIILSIANWSSTMLGGIGWFCILLVYNVSGCVVC